MMKKMNKVAAAVLAVAMVGSMAVPAFAAASIQGTVAATGGTDNNLTQYGTTKLNFSLGESYNWQIPAEITLDTESKAAVSSSVVVTDCVIDLDHTLTIKINPLKADGATQIGTFKLNTTVNGKADQAERGYKVEKTEGTTVTELKNSDTVLTLESGKNSGSQSLTFTLLDDQEEGKKIAGDYTGYVKFTAEVN